MGLLKPSTTLTVLSEHQKEVIDGILLSDGSIRMRGRTPEISLGNIQKDWIEDVRRILHPMIFCYWETAPRTIMIKDRIVNCRRFYSIRSHVDGALHNFVRRWLINGKKIIPEDLIITPTVLKYWFYGDGSTSRRGNTISLTLCTECFTVSECEALKIKIYDAVGVKMNIGKNKRLTISKKDSVKHLLDFMGTSILECFDYKWKRPGEVL